MKTLRKEALAGYQRALVARLLALQGAQASDRAVLESNHGFSKDPEFAAAALHSTEEAVSVELVTARANELRHVKYALGRVGDGTYGFCEMCGKAIPPARLDAVPHATCCVKCQREVERSQGIWQREPDALLNLQDPDTGQIDLVCLENCLRF